VVLSYRKPDLALRCAASIAAGRRVPEFSIIVENESRTGNGARLRAEAPAGSHLVELPENEGFAGGMNAGIREALRLGADLIALFNNDSELLEETLEHLEAETARRPDAALIGAAELLLPEQEVRGPLLGFDWRDGRVTYDATTGVTTEPFVSGCALLVRAAALERLGLLDERFFLYCEDVDWSLRARRLGLAIAAAEGALVRHDYSATTGKRSALSLYYETRNKFLLARHAPLGRRFGPYQVAVGARAFKHARRFFRSGDDERARAILAGLTAGLRGRFGRQVLEAPAGLAALTRALRGRSSKRHETL
jgi:GT2 family glycosyltransferase